MYNSAPAMAAWFGYPIELHERLRMIRQTGFRSVLLWWDEVQPYELPISQKVDAAHSAGLEVENAHMPFSNMNCMWLEGIEGDAYCDMLCRLIRQAHTYGVPTLVVHLTRTKTPPQANKLGYSRFMRLVDTAESSGVNLAFENLKAYERLYQFMPMVDSSRVGVCFDSGHNNCHCPDRRVAVDFAQRIMAVHLHDNDGTRDAHLMPFDGTTDWAQVKRELIACAYKGAWSLEIEYDPQGIFSARRAKTAAEFYSELSAEQYLQTAIERVNRLLSLEVG